MSAIAHDVSALTGRKREMKNEREAGERAGASVNSRSRGGSKSTSLFRVARGYYYCRANSRINSRDSLDALNNYIRQIIRQIIRQMAYNWKKKKLGPFIKESVLPTYYTRIQTHAACTGAEKCVLITRTGWGRAIEKIARVSVTLSCYREI
ncbi:hypothetical protein PUN28_000159 [Cardiocondyla obscurior]|uniref:Ribosomal protein S14 n=1 Tax=Cardiocondyla obscurior TaxID=286306 RepID=A0AAW2GY06_9HYME